MTPTNTGQLIVAISVEAFADVAAFKGAVDAAIASMHGSPTLPGFDAVRVPGENSHAVRAQREAEGIPVHAGLLGALNELGARLGVANLT